LGAELVRKCCEEPLRKIYANSNYDDAGFVLEKLKELKDPKVGYNARTKKIEKLETIVDPVKVVKSSLRYGAGLASILLTAECAVIDEEYDFFKRVHE